MRSTSHYKDFTKYQVKAAVKDELYKYTELLLIKDGGIK